MKRIVCLLAASTLSIALLAGCSSTPSTASTPATGEKQTVSAWMSEEENRAKVTVDLTGGWSADYAPGAVYLYEGENTEGRECDAMCLTLSKDVYEDYLKDSEEHETQEIEGGIAYTSDYGERLYLFSVDGKPEMYFMLSVPADADGDAIFDRITVEPEFKSDDSSSNLYTDEEIEQAIAVVKEEFEKWKGCELLDIRYAGDECNTPENIEWLNTLKDGGTFTQCLELLANFHSPTNEENLKESTLEHDTDYNDYQWWLARTDDGEWELVSWGY